MASCSRRRCPSCCTGSVPGTSRTASEHGTPTVMTPSGLDHVGFRAATQHERLQTREPGDNSGEDCLAHTSTQASRDAQLKGGSTAKPRVPRTCAEQGQGGALTPVNTTAAFTDCGFRQRRRKQTCARTQGLKPRSERDMDTAAHEQQRSGHDGSRTARLQHLRRRQTTRTATLTYGIYATKRNTRGSPRWR